MAEACFAEGKVAVITGASSGIGFAAARHCARRKMKVFLADSDAAGLEEARAAVQGISEEHSEDGRGHGVFAVETDVADPEALKRLKDAAFAAGSVSFLMNNAGVGAGAGALGPLEDLHRTLDVNMWGPIHGCQAFVPAMKESGEPGLIVNTGSKQGITCPPGTALSYNMSKAALKVYTEGLEHELRQAPGRPLRAALLVPGWTNTSIMLKGKRDAAAKAGEAFDPDSVFFHEGKPAAGAWMPDQVVEFMLSELARDRFYIICPDNDVDRETDNLRMTWAMQDITLDRPPLSRWHPDHSDAFNAYLAANKTAAA